MVQVLAGIRAASTRAGSQALTQATTGKTGSFISNFMQMCFVYDPVTSRYSMNVLAVVRAGGVVTVAAMMGVWLGLWWRARRRQAEGVREG